MNSTQVLPIYPTLLMPMTYYLGVDFFILTLQILSASGNGFIILLFLRTKRLRKNKALWLLLCLSITDFIFALSIFPYMIYFVLSWNPVVFDYNALFTVITSAPVVIQFKINTAITIMIGVDRIQAINFPVYYRTKNHVLFIFITFALGIGLAIIDVCFEFITTNFNIHRYNCSALGCFQDPIFQEYWGISNMTLDVIGLFFTSWVTWKIQHKKGHKLVVSHGADTKEMKQMSQANRLSVGIFMVSFIFLTIPSTSVGIAQFAKLSIFQIFGPFYAIGLLLAGIFNSIIYITLHAELRRAAVDFKHAIFIYIFVVHSLSVPVHDKWTMDLTFYMEISLAVYFTTEFLIRIWSIGADAKYAGYDGFIQYMKKFTSIVDIVIISVTFLIIFAHNGELEPKTLEKVQFLQILRLLHIDRQLTTWKMIKKMIVRSFEELVTLYWISGLVFVFLAYCVYEIETFYEANQLTKNVTIESTFENYGESFWFSIITVLTVGYGDIVPKHWISKLAVAVLCLLGVCLFSAASSLVGVGLSLMVENEAKIQQEAKVKNLAARLIQTWYRFYLISDDDRFANFRQFRKFCSDLHHVEERIKLARILAKNAAVKRQIKPKIFSQYSFKRRGSDPEKHSDSYSKVATELGITTSTLLNSNRNRSFKIQDLLSDKSKNSLPRKLSTFVSSGELPPLPPRKFSSGSMQPRVLQHLQSLSSAPLGISMFHPQQFKDVDPSIISYSETSTGSIAFSDEEKLLDYYYDPYKGDNTSVGRRSQDTTISALDDEAINRYRQILRMLHYFIFQITKKKFHRARRPYELMDAETELAEMEYQRMQKIKELELRIQATIGKPTISPFEMDDNERQKRNIEDRIELCEMSLGKFEMKMQIVENLAGQILESFQNKSINSLHGNQNPRERFVSTGHDNREIETKNEIKLKDEQKRRVLFKEKSFG